MNNVVAEMQTAMRLIALGIDYTRYVSFQMITPPDATTINSSQPQFHASGVMRRHLAADHFTFGRTFVIESALSAARADHLIRTRAERLALPRGNRGDYETITWEG
jgi:hypothetical protein